MRVSQRTSVSGQYVCSVFNNKALTASCSNCQGSLLQDIFRYARYPPQVLQVEIHPYLTQEPIVELAKTLGVAVTAYSSFGPQGWIEISMDKGLPSLFTHDVVTSISKKNQKSTHLFSLLIVALRIADTVISRFGSSTPAMVHSARYCRHSQEYRPRQDRR